MKRKIRLFVSVLFNITGLFSLLVFLNKLFKRNKVIILMYHRVFDLDDKGEFPHCLAGPSSGSFRMQVEYLSKKYNLITLEELALFCREKKHIPPNSAVITIDDGYIDCYRNIFPILKKYNAPATMFLPTGYVGTDLLFWVDELAYRIKNTKLKEFSLDGLGGRFKLESKKDRQEAMDSVIKIFKRLKEENRRQAMDALIKLLSNEEKISANLNLTWEQVREMAGQRVSFGAHTITHPILTRINEEEARKEILGSKRRIEQEIKKPVLTFCYPSGENDTFNEFHKEILKENGFLCAVSTVSGTVGRKSDLFALKRIYVDKADTMALFKAKLSGIFSVFAVREKPQTTNRNKENQG